MRIPFKVTEHSFQHYFPKLLDYLNSQSSERMSGSLLLRTYQNGVILTDMCKSAVEWTVNNFNYQNV